MPFVTKFAAEFAQGLLDRIQVVLESATIGANPALAVIDAALDPFVDFDTPIPKAINFPALYLEPSQSKLEQSEDDSHIKGEHEFIITLAIVANEPDVVKKRIGKYLRAVDQALRTMSAADLATAVTSSKARPAWEVTEHRYGAIFEDENTIYRKSAQLLFVVQILER